MLTLAAENCVLALTPWRLVFFPSPEGPMIAKETEPPREAAKPLAARICPRVG